MSSDSYHDHDPNQKPSATQLTELLEECFKDVKWATLRSEQGKLIELSNSGGGHGYEKEARWMRNKLESTRHQ